MINQTTFETQHKEQWLRFEKWLNVRDSTDQAEFPQVYLQLTQHFALAQQRQYSPRLVAFLQDLVYRGHLQLYKDRSHKRSGFIQFIMQTFPRRLRQHWKLFIVANFLFYGPFLAFGIACYLNGDFILSILPYEQVASMESMYDPDNRIIGAKEDSQSSSRFYMFGYYIMNNIGIGFRTFALGLLLGIGTVFILLFNGTVIGAVAGHLTQLGFNETFWSFVSGHGSFELTAITICGVAGLNLARPLFQPGQLTRRAALVQSARHSTELALGSGFMLLVAAFIEAFWSSRPEVSNLIKYLIAALLWAIVIVYLYHSGRDAQQ